ncbi:MAG: hypothetical protein PVJ64_00410 [Gemmatimonadales bacterium]|jgi:hypothetical protein
MTERERLIERLKALVDEDPDGVLQIRARDLLVCFVQGGWSSAKGDPWYALGWLEGATWSGLDRRKREEAA